MVRGCRRGSGTIQQHYHFVLAALPQGRRAVHVADVLQTFGASGEKPRQQHQWIS